MNREIKFRCWDRVEKKMIYNALEIKNIGLGEGSVIADEEAQKGNELDWMQYTGLKDKHGKEIYEGDVVRHHDGGKIKYVMEWDGERARWSYGGFPCRPKEKGGITDYEIIGNICETPELLK